MDRKGWTILLSFTFPRFDSIRFSFLCGHVKTIVYPTKPSLEDLKAKITNVISSITINHLANVFRELQNRITLCVANNGGHVET